MNLRSVVVVSLFVVVAYSGSAGAEEGIKDLTSSSRGSFQLGVAPIFGFSPGFFCNRDMDMVGCHDFMFVARPQIDAQYRTRAAWFAIGIVGGVDIAPYEAILWRAAVEARFYPLIRRNAELWLALEGGLVGAAGDAVDDVGGEVGGGLGVDFPICRHLFIGLDIRALFYGFGADDGRVPDGKEVEINNSVWFSLGLIKLGARFSL